MWQNGRGNGRYDLDALRRDRTDRNKPGPVQPGLTDLRDAVDSATETLQQGGKAALSSSCWRVTRTRMRSLGVLARLIYLGVSYVWDYGPLSKRDESGMQRLLPGFAARCGAGRSLRKLGSCWLRARSDRTADIESARGIADKCPAEPLHDSTETIRGRTWLTAERAPFALLGEVASASFGCVYRVRLAIGPGGGHKGLRRGDRGSSKA